MPRRDERLVYIDIATPMLGDDGEPRPEIFVADNLHMNGAGYDIWRDVVRPHPREGRDCPRAAMTL